METQNTTTNAQTQSIEECDDYTCPSCRDTYTGEDWREVRRGRAILLVCPTCDDAEND